MKKEFTKEAWTIEKLIKLSAIIEFPEFQREPTIWRLDKKQRLIDSIFRGFDISSIYLCKREDGKYDCIDGQQKSWRAACHAHKANTSLHVLRVISFF